MWLGVVTSLSILTLSIANQKAPARNGVEWGWQMRDQGPGSVGHYYVRLPQSEQQVHYVADGSGYHGALAHSTIGPQHSVTSNFALGRRALELDSQISSQVSPRIQNEIQDASATSDLRAVQNPLDIFLLQTHYASTPNQLFQIIPDPNLVQYNSIPNIYFNDLPKAEYYNYVQHKNVVIPEQNNLVLNTNQNVGSFPLYSENVNTKPDGPIEVVQVFKDSNCSNKYDVEHKNNDNKESAKLDNTNDLTAVHGNFGEKETRPIYRGTVNFKVESPRTNARNERLYYSNLSGATTPTSVTLTEEESISRLVASTQDLISNDDLLKINHAEESSGIYPQNDDLIKPRPRFSVRSQGAYNSRQTVPQSHVSVSTNYGNIVNTKTQHINNERNKHLDDHKFKSPIIVSDENGDNFKQNIVNNFISTMVPYLEEGYELVGVRNSLDEDPQSSDEDLVNITPRPISQNYLTPITVALRLLESNTTDLQDHEISESENIEDTAMPEKERTIVEIQQSIPIEITHINDVEYHREYMDEGRSFNRPYHYGKALYNEYGSSERNGARPNKNTDYNDKPTKNSKDNEQSGNTYSEDQVTSNQQQDYRNYNPNHQIVQPIIIEKEIPVTKFVDRYIEKQVPYPERVEVVKHVPVDRPVAVPVRYDTIVEKPVEVTRYIDKPYPVEVPKPYPVEVRVPYPVEHKVYVDRPVHVPYAVEKVVEKNVIHPVAIPTPVAVPVPVEKQVLFPVPIEKPVPVPVPVEKPVDRIVHKEVPVPYPVEKRIPYPVHHEVKIPVPYPVEKRIPVPVEKPVTKIVEKHIKVPVPQPVPYEVHVPKPYPVDRIVEKKIPYPVHIDRIVEKKVPYPVNTVVEKIVEKPVIVTKYVDKPYPVERRVPYPVDRIVEKRVPYPVEVKVPYQQKPDTPYQFEQVDPIYYSYGSGYQNPIQYIPKVSTLQQNQQLHNYMQVQAESQRNYQIQKASDEYLKSLSKQNIPVQTSTWGNHYASSYSYLNTTEKNYFPPNYIETDQKYYGPPPTTAYNFTWEKNQDFDKRRTDRAPKNLRIEYGGFKPPLIPSTEVDLDGNPIKKQN